MNKNKRLHRCDDCGNRQFISRAELARRFKPKCIRCGCSRLELVSEDAVKEVADINSARLEQRSQLDRKRSGQR